MKNENLDLLKNKLQDIVIDILNSKKIEKQLKQSSLKEISSFLKACSDILNELTKTASKKKDQPLTAEDFIKNLSEKENEKAIQVFGSPPKNKNKKESVVKTAKDGTLLPRVK